MENVSGSGHGHSHRARGGRGAGRRSSSGSAVVGVRADRGVLRRRGGRRPDHQLAGPALGRRPTCSPTWWGWAWRWRRSTSRTGRRPAPTGPSACTASRSSRRWRTPSCCSGSASTCWSRRSSACAIRESIESGLMLVVAIVGLIVNVVAMLLLRDGASESLNVRGAYLEVLADLLASGGVVAGGADRRADRLGLRRPVDRRSDRCVHLPPHGEARRAGATGPRAGGAAGDRRRGGAPRSAAAPRCGRRTRSARVDAHLRHGGGVRPSHGRRGNRHPRGARPGRDLLGTSYGVHHATLQIEPDDHRGCDEVNW